MSVNLFVGIWIALALCVVALAVYRNLLGIREPGVHISPTIALQGLTERPEFAKEERVERWGQWLTLLVVVYGLILSAIYLYSSVGTRQAGESLNHGRCDDLR